MSELSFGQPGDDIRFRIKKQAERWKAALTDLGKSNNALYFVERKSGTLRLPSFPHPQIVGLANGAATLDLGPLFSTDDRENMERGLRRIRDVARSNEQDRGLRTLYVAFCTATWRSPDATKDSDRAIRAPVVFLPVIIDSTTRGPVLRRAGDLILNAILIAAIEKHYAIKFDLPAGSDGPELPDRLEAILDLVGQAYGSVPSFLTEGETWLSNFSFSRQSMVEDIAANVDLLERSMLVRAFCEDESALVALQAGVHQFKRDRLDDIDPITEGLVIEADEYQRAAIKSLVESTSSGVIDGPPGTGKSQTIANLIAALLARNQRVLFVAEKQAALDAVMKRLQDSRLDHLVLNLHGADVKRRTIYERLKDCDARSKAIGLERAPVAVAEAAVRKRNQLNEYYSAINRPIEGANLSFRDLVGQIGMAAQDECAGSPLWTSVIPSAEMLEEAIGKVHLIARHAKIFRRDPAEPWARAAFDGVALQDAQKAIDDARVALRDLVGFVESFAALLDTDVKEAEDIDRLRVAAVKVAGVRATFKPEIAALDTKRELETYRRVQNPVARWFASIFDREYKAAVGRVGLVAEEALPVPELFQHLESFLAIDASLRSESVLRVVDKTYPSGIDARQTMLTSQISRASVVSGEAGLPTAFQDLEAALSRLATSRNSAAQAYDVRMAERWLEMNKFGPLLEALRVTSISPEGWGSFARACWAVSYVERSLQLDPLLRNFDRSEHEARIIAFEQADEEAMKETASRLRISAAQRYERARREFPKQKALLDREMVKQRTSVTVRSFVEKAWEITSTLCPCWMASPLSVSNLISARAAFDVIIFDEASQVTPENAITAIIRGNRTIVAGDEQQLPPTRFFAAGASDGDGSDLDGLESLLTQMVAFASEGRQQLSVHYRSRDESLIRFSNDEFYRRLVTFPSAGGNNDGVSHELVTEPSAPGDTVSSTSEVERIAELVKSHAREHPGESLGLIAMGTEHADRIDLRLQRLRATDPEFDAFCSRHESQGNDVFVKNIERVQGDERDAIILSLGYAKQPGRSLPNFLGPINMSNGQRRINVAITRAKVRMIVVSTFTENDMPDSSFKSNGAPVLKRFVAYARRRGERPTEERKPGDGDLPPLEQDVIAELRKRGLDCVVHVGTSDARVEIGVRDPADPARFVLAIEGDGAAYERSRTARDRDYLRQRQLEKRGWRFHRIWTPNWYADRELEVELAFSAYEAAVAAAAANTSQARNGEFQSPASVAIDAMRHGIVEGECTVEIATAAPSKTIDVSSSGQANGTLPGVSFADPVQDVTIRSSPSGSKPPIPYRANIDEHDFSDLEALCDWIMSDGTARDNEALMRDLMSELGYRRKGERIEKRLSTVIRRFRKRSSRTTMQLWSD